MGLARISPQNPSQKVVHPRAFFGPNLPISRGIAKRRQRLKEVEADEAAAKVALAKARANKNKMLDESFDEEDNEVGAAAAAPVSRRKSGTGSTPL